MKGLRKCVFAWAASLAAMGWARESAAAGFATAHFGGELGNVVTTSPTALYFNPAGIGFSDGIHLFADGQIALRGATWDHPAGAPGDPPMPPANLGNSGHASLLNVFGAPSLGATMKLGNLALGAGLFVPFGGQEHWSQNSSYQNSNPLYQGPLDGVQRWHIIQGQLAFIYLTAGAAYRLGPLSIGATGNLIPSMVSFTNAQSLGPTAPLPSSANEGRASLDVSGLSASFGVGAMIEAVPKTVWVGLSYQSQPGMGPQTLSGTLSVTSVGASLPIKNVDFTQGLPDIVRAGVKARVLDDLELRLYADFTRWSVMQTQCLSFKGIPCQVYPDGSDASGGKVIANYRRNWNDTYNVHVGGSYYYKPEIELFAGAAFETAATPDATMEPGLADADSIQGSLGGRFFLFDFFYLAASYTQLQFLNRDNTGLSTLSTAKGPTAQQDGGGKYTQWVGFLDVNVEKVF